jgi:hypothetical protein
MAVVIGFEKVIGRKSNRHPTDVICYWSILPSSEGGPLLQLDTRGSNTRTNPGKQSQTLQFTADGARELLRILRNEFERDRDH